MCGLNVKCSFCEQLVKSTNSTWAKNYGTVHKSCYDLIKK